ncbi:DUF6527 family protein [Phenylobacterium sp.]|uniref:DUF6527 family protein n=1 Tax=Phenylobacterium sp. TaxID=1871053 RepID=UPI00271BECF9|nr:DUF6527 family protein [Phenylobacterium sp.]MDO8381003.1 DUF6527 family protein [Phenylobacterium sp.]
MRANFAIEHAFVDFMPDVLEERTLYISIEFATASHRCFCGCGAEVVTPISPVGWQLTFDGETVSLSPSVGSWSLPCQSHYWIRRDMVEWAPGMTAEEIAGVRRRDDFDRVRHYGAYEAPAKVVEPPKVEVTLPSKPRGFFAWLADLFR